MAANAIIPILGCVSTVTYADYSLAQRALGWVLDGYSDGQIAKKLRCSASDVAAARAFLRSEGRA